MIAKVKTNLRKAFFLTGLLTAMFFVVICLFEIHNVLMVLNGIFFGILTSGTIIYRNLAWDIFNNKIRLDRTRQFMLGVVFSWIGSIGVCSYFGVYRYVIGDGNGNPYLVAGIIYLFIISNILKITAPAFDDNFSQSTEKRLVLLSALSGAAVAVLMILFQGAMV